MSFTLSRRVFAAGAACLPVACLGARSDALRTSAVPRAPAISNPLVKNRADAQIFLNDDGYYYMTGSVPEYDRLVLRRSRTIAGLTEAEERVLWRHGDTGPLSGFIWAPELHRIDGRWHMYFAAGPSGGGEDVFRIRTYAVICDGPDPMTGNWKVLGEFQTPWDSFNLDSTMFRHRGTRYFVWAQREPGIETNSNLYIAPLATPLTLGAEPTRLTVPTLDWEIRGFKVNEAPAVLERNGRLFITYSASATDDRYCLGLVAADADAKIMDSRAWSKSPRPVFQTSQATSVYGPGHNSFTIDERGRDMLVYHGRDYREIEGDPLFNPDRHTRAQRLYFAADGTPDFGVPVGNGPLPERFSPAAHPGQWLAHQAGQPMVGALPLAQTQYRSVSNGDGTLCLSPILLRDHHLTVTLDGYVRLIPAADAEADGQSTRFRRREHGDGSMITLDMPVFPGMALAYANGKLAIAPSKDATSKWLVD